MDQQVEPTTIKKYANRRLYNTGTSTYVTLDDLAEMVKNGEDFRVVDAKSGDEITRSVLTQIIFEQEGKGQNLLPVNFLRQLIRFYGDSMQGLIPSFLDFSLKSLVREQEKWRGQALGPFGTTANPFASGALEALNEQARRNTEMFEQAMRMFLQPFSGKGDASGGVASGATGTEKSGGDIETLKREVDEMQKRLDRLSGKGSS
jgi:polyhydroxyalkanoate synthesis repressor PhaR